MEELAGSGLLMRTAATMQAADLSATESRPVELADTAGLMRLYRARIFRYILYSTRDEDVAETLTQECFLRAFDARAQFRGECAISTWLMHIAVNLVRDHLRSRRLRFWRKAATIDAAEISDRLPDRISSAEDRLIARQRVAAVWEAVEGLSARQRNVFHLRFVEELELSEIAELTGMHLSTAKSHLYRAVATVKRKLEAQR
jgi:RNA polymerase sigma-70 factor (ECF subfamily)